VSTIRAIYVLVILSLVDAVAEYRVTFSQLSLITSLLEIACYTLTNANSFQLIHKNSN